jgi:hypothetical protein
MKCKYIKGKWKKVYNNLKKEIATSSHWHEAVWLVQLGSMSAAASRSRVRVAYKSWMSKFLFCATYKLNI